MMLLPTPSQVSEAGAAQVDGLMCILTDDLLEGGNTRHRQL